MGASAPPKANAADLSAAPGTTIFLLRSFFQQSLLQFFLALDAMPRPGDGIQPLGIDVSAAMNALAKIALAQPHQRLIHHLQQLALVIALAEEKFLGVGTGGSVGDVLRRIFVRRAAVFLRAVDRDAQLLPPRLQSLLERFQLLFVHKSLQNSWDVPPGIAPEINPKRRS